MGVRGVLCVGGAVVDLKFTLRGPAVPETSNPANGGTAFGGVARNVAANLAALRVPARLLSAVGGDLAGGALRVDLRRAGVGVEHLHERPGRPTAQYAAVLDPDGRLVIAAAAMDVMDTITPAELDAAWPEAGWVFCDANLPADVLAHALATARDPGINLALDAVSTPKVTRLPARLDGAALINLNVDEARAYLAAHGRQDGDDPEALARAVHRSGVRAVLLTLGERGVLVAGEHGVRRVPARRAVPVDVTGAGDALVAATIAGLIAGRPLLDAVAAGVERAARTVESPSSVLRPEEASS